MGLGGQCLYHGDSLYRRVMRMPSVRYLGSNIRVGYWFSPNFSLHFGYFYTTMLVSVPTTSAVFGFNNISGPQLFPVFFIGPIYAYGKYSPIADQFKLLAISSNREIAAGLGYVLQKKKSQAWVFAFDYSNMPPRLGRSALTVIVLYGECGVSFLVDPHSVTRERPPDTA